MAYNNGGGWVSKSAALKENSYRCSFKLDNTRSIIICVGRNSYVPDSRSRNSGKECVSVQAKIVKNEPMSKNNGLLG